MNKKRSGLKRDLKKEKEIKNKIDSLAGKYDDKKLKYAFYAVAGLLILMLVYGVFISSNSTTGYVTATDVTKGASSSIITAFNEGLKPVAKLIFGKDGDSGDVIFSKTLIFLALIGLMWAILSQIEFIEENKTMSLLAVAAISILAVRFLTKEIIEGLILVPADTFIVALIAIVIFAGLFYFIEVKGPFRDYPIFRKICWIIVGSTFLGLWWIVRDDAGNAPLTYILGGVFAFILFLIDGTIHKAVARGKIAKSKARIASNAISELGSQYTKFNKQLVEGSMDVTDYNQKIKDLDRSINAIMKRGT